MSTNPEPLFTRSDYKLRLAALMGAGTCVLAGILLLLSIGASLFRWNFINSGPGDLFTGAYGMFAFTVPLYLFWAAWILCDPVFKPGRIFLLSTVIVPFLTVAIGFSFVRDFEMRRGEFALLDALGRSGFSLLIITAAILEGLGILVLYSLLFDRAKNPVNIPRLKAESPRTIIQRIQPVTVFTPAADPVPVRQEPDPVVTNQYNEEYVLPEWKPLKSTAAFRNLDRNRAEKNEIVPPAADESISENQVVILTPSVFSPYAQVSSAEQPERFEEPANMEPENMKPELELEPVTETLEDEAPEMETPEMEESGYDEEALLDHGDWIEADPFENEAATETAAVEETDMEEFLPEMLIEEAPAETECSADAGPRAVDVPQTAKKNRGSIRGPIRFRLTASLPSIPTANIGS